MEKEKIIKMLDKIENEISKLREYIIKEDNNKEDEKVNWENCKNDLQRLVAYWIKIDNPYLYKTATRNQITGIYGRLSKSCKEILTICGDLDTAKKSMGLCRDWLIEKKLSYTIETVLRHITKFIDMVKKGEILPIEVDKDLWQEYCFLRTEKNGNFDKEKVIAYLKDIIRLGKNPNKVLEEKIVSLKRNSNEVPEDVKSLILKAIKNIENN